MVERPTQLTDKLRSGGFTFQTTAIASAFPTSLEYTPIITVATDVYATAIQHRLFFGQLLTEVL